MTQTQREVLTEAIDYIVTVIDKQGFLPNVETMYGDGSRWTALTRKGFYACYESVKETLIEKGILCQK